jgi:hypothetical protein
MPVDDFVGVVTAILGILKDHCPPFLVQRCKVQCLSQPNVTRNPLQILASRIGNVGDKIGPFGRPPAFFGVRFRFQPWSPPDEDEDEADEEHEVNAQEAGNEAAVSHPPGENLPATIEEADDDETAEAIEARDYVTVRFEPYSEDPSQVWIEVAAGYFAQDEPIRLADLFNRVAEYLADVSIRYRQLQEVLRPV